MSSQRKRIERYTRHPRKNLIKLTKRDREIFKVLMKYRYLRTKEIWELMPKDVRGPYNSKFRDRLRDLFNGYQLPGERPVYWLQRPRGQMFSYNALYSQMLYSLAKHGREEALDEGATRDDYADLVRRGWAGSEKQLTHALMIIDPLVALEKAINAMPNRRFKRWSEIMRDAPKQKPGVNPFALPAYIEWTFDDTKHTISAEVSIIPDAVFGIEYLDEGKTRYFAYEAEHKNKVWARSFDETSWLKKVLAYRDIIRTEAYKTTYGIDNLRVIAGTATKEKTRRLKELVDVVTEGRGSTRFLFVHVPALGYEDEEAPSLDKLFTSGIERVGHPPFHLDRFEQGELAAA